MNEIIGEARRLVSDVTSWNGAVLPLVTLVFAVVAGLLIHAVTYRLGRRLAGHSDSLAVRLLARVRRQTRLAAILLALAIVLPRVRLGLFWGDFFAHLALILLISFIGWTAATLVGFFADRTLSSYELNAEDNYQARKVYTQMRVLRQTANILIFLFTVGAILMSFDEVREYGVSIFASAGAAGLVLGFAARPVLANLIAGIQIALTQPIKIEDVVIVEGEWGWIEEIGATYVVVRIWDLRRLVVPLSYFIEKPFQNWTRDSASIIGSVVWHADYTVPVGAVRAKLEELVRGHPLWDGRTVNLQVVEATAETVQLRGLMSARNSPMAWDLRCDVRERMLAWLQSEFPGALPRTRGEIMVQGGAER